MLANKEKANYKHRGTDESKSKKELLNTYKGLLNKYYRKVIAYSEVVKEDFGPPLINIAREIGRNNAALKDMEVNKEGFFFNLVNIEMISYKELETSLSKVVHGIIDITYKMMDSNAVDKLISQLNSNFSKILGSWVK